ncbi:MAG: hypothetical protein IJ224_08280, partial [Lachnospiraceae bacterium]|nr:hypothetical protein [Lachnospiraceae bacterium]
MRKKMKRFLGILLSLALVLGLMPQLMPGMCLTVKAETSGKCVLSVSREDEFTVRRNVIETPITLSCDANSSGELDDIIQNIMYDSDKESWPAGPCVAEAPTVEGGNGAITAGLDENDYQYIKINEQFTGTATVTGKYNNGTEVIDYTFTITTSDYIPVESLTFSHDTEQTISVGDVVAFTATIMPDNASVPAAEISISGTDTSAVKLYSDENCQYEMPADNAWAQSGRPFYVKGVSAGTVTITVTPYYNPELAKSCDVTVSGESTTHTHDGITFVPWSDPNDMPYVAGNYYLTTDVTMNMSWSLNPGVMNLCLNGHSITCTDAACQVIYISDINSEGATLNLYDNADNSGSITGTGGGVEVIGNGIFNMYGGSIKDCLLENSNNGGGVNILQGGTFNMYGGSISGNISKGNDGGGGVHVGNGTFNMYGGSITDNTSNRWDSGNGGGVYVDGSGTFNMYGGSITGNTASNFGGGVYVDRNSGTFTISGDASITENFSGSQNTSLRVNNVFLWPGKTISVTGALTGDGKIGVTMLNPSVFTSSSDPIKAKDYIYRFTSDVGYKIEPEGNELKMIEPYITVGGTMVYDDNAADVFGDDKVKFTPAEGENPAVLELTDYTFDGTSRNILNGISYAKQDQLIIVLNGSNSVKGTGRGIFDFYAPIVIRRGENGGSLEAVGTNYYGIECCGLTVESGTVYATGGEKGLVNEGTLTLGSGIDFLESTDGETYTAVNGDSSEEKYVEFEDTNIPSKPEQTIDASDVNATYGETNKSVSATVTEPTTGGGDISYTVKSGSENYIDVASDGKLTIKAVPPTDGKAYVIVKALETPDYAQTTKEVTITIAARITTETLDDGSTVETMEDGFKTTVAEKDPSGNTTKITEIVEEDNKTTATEKNPSGDITKITETVVDGNKTTVTEKDPDNNVTKTTETVTNNDGSKTETVKEGNKTTVTEKDSDDHVTKTTETVINDDDSKTETVKEGNKTTVTETNNQGQVTKTTETVTKEDGSKTKTVKEGNKTTVTETNNQNQVTKTTETVINDDDSKTETVTEGNKTTITETDNQNQVTKTTETVTHDDNSKTETVTEGNTTIVTEKDTSGNTTKITEKLVDGNNNSLNDNNTEGQLTKNTETVTNN